MWQIRSVKVISYRILSWVSADSMFIVAESEGGAGTSARFAGMGRKSSIQESPPTIRQVLTKLCRLNHLCWRALAMNVQPEIYQTISCTGYLLPHFATLLPHTEREKYAWHTSHLVIRFILMYGSLKLLAGHHCVSNSLFECRPLIPQKVQSYRAFKGERYMCPTGYLRCYHFLCWCPKASSSNWRESEFAYITQAIRKKKSYFPRAKTMHTRRWL